MTQAGSGHGIATDEVKPLSGSEWINFTAFLCVLYEKRRDEIEPLLRQAGEKAFPPESFEDRFAALRDKLLARYDELTAKA